MLAEDVRHLAALFGRFDSLDEAVRTAYGRTTWRVHYTHKDSSLVAAGALLDSPVGEVDFRGMAMDDAAKDALLTAVSAQV